VAHLQTICDMDMVCIRSPTEVHMVYPSLNITNCVSHIPIALEGNFCKDKRHGWGKRIYADERIYEGNYADEAPNGEGKMTWPDRSEYQGEFQHGRREGHGKNFAACYEELA